MFVFGVITARGGSRRLPGKNLLSLAGKPLIGWIIEAARNSSALDRLILSTDDSRIARCAKDFGAEVPFLRPPELAEDDSSSEETVQHAVRWLEESGKIQPDLVVVLQPTSPLRTTEEIDAAISLAVSTDADSVEAIIADDATPSPRYRLVGDRLLPCFPAGNIHSSLSTSHRLYKGAAGVYVVRRAVLMQQGRLRGEDHRGLLVPEGTSVDIDTLRDLRMAEAIIAERNR